MRRLDWLIARPIAHRGLHDAARGIVENTALAVSAAVAAGYGVEVDLQPSRDGEAMVHHDAALGRLVEGHELLRDLDAATLRTRAFRTGGDHLLTLGELLDLVAGRVPLLIELKSRFDRSTTLSERAAAVLRPYAGAAAVMSFDPALIADFGARAPAIPRGMLAERRLEDDDLSADHRPNARRLGWLLDAPRVRPSFVAYRLQDLNRAPPRIARRLGLPLLAWTVRSEAERTMALRYADQVIFEGFRA